MIQPNMRRWLLPIALLLVITLSVILVRQRSEKQAQAEREAGYQSAVHAYSEVLKPGMTRKDFEEYLGARNLRFRHMCCVEMKDFPKGVYDDLKRLAKRMRLGCGARKMSMLLFNSQENPETQLGRRPMLLTDWGLSRYTAGLKAASDFC
jgi:hypothetical protein